MKFYAIFLNELLYIYIYIFLQANYIEHFYVNRCHQRRRLCENLLQRMQEESLAISLGTYVKRSPFTPPPPNTKSEIQKSIIS